ncbi:hypothetical protein BY996DRAFT_6440348 [Phakopsora pachyrhizi]|nr:hypothetical protein BY996DRAFT_6440348 [Phakopsora pachyrhizi]
MRSSSIMNRFQRIKRQGSGELGIRREKLESAEGHQDFRILPSRKATNCNIGSKSV